jgi:hypothetical protein
MKIFGKKGIAFEKMKLTDSKIDSTETTTITLNVKNFKEKFENIIVITKTDDLDGQYLKIDKPMIQLPPLDFPNRNTGDHTITITPHNIPLNKMSFKITVEVFSSERKAPMLKKEFSLLVSKR